MNIEAMKQLVRVLKAADPMHFNMCDTLWVADGAARCMKVVPPEEIHNCGTSACAIGYAALDPWFQSKGLTLTINKGDRAGYLNTNKAMEVLGLTAVEFQEIFYWGHRDLTDIDPMAITPLMMVDVVEEMIGRYQREPA